MEHEPEEGENFRGSRGEIILHNLIVENVDRNDIIEFLVRIIAGIEGRANDIRDVDVSYFNKLNDDLEQVYHSDNTGEVDEVVSRAIDGLLALGCSESFFYQLAQDRELKKPDETSYRGRMVTGKEVRERAEKSHHVGSDIDIEKARQELGDEIKKDELADREKTFWEEADKRIADGRIKDPSQERLNNQEDEK